MSSDNCKACSKKVYPLEAVTAENAKYHKGCFKCATCTSRVTLTTYKSKGGEIYCVKCVPKEQHTSVADSVVMESARKGESLKKEVGIQKSNVITGERGSQTADTMQNTEAKKASELNRTATAVKSNVITGERGTQTADDMSVTNAQKAQKENSRLEKSNVITGEAHNMGHDAMVIASQSKAQEQASTIVTANVITGEANTYMAPPEN